MADVVEHELKPWEASAGRRTALGAGGLLLGLGALALLLQGESVMGGLAAAATAAGLLVVGGIVLARGQDEPDAGVAVALLAVLYAGVAGLLLAPGELGSWQWPLPASSSAHRSPPPARAMLLVGVVAVVGLREGRSLVIPAIVVGAMLAASGLLMQVAEFDPSVVFTVLMTLVVLAGSIFPWLALGVTGTKVDQIYSLHDITADPDDDRPRPGRRRRAGGARDPARRVGDGRHAAGPAGSAGREPRRLRHHPGGGVLPGRHVPHPAVPRRLRGPGRPRLRHPRPRSRWPCRCC